MKRRSGAFAVVVAVAVGTLTAVTSMSSAEGAGGAADDPVGTPGRVEHATASPERVSVRPAGALSTIKISPTRKAGTGSLTADQLMDLRTAAATDGTDLETLKASHVGATEFALAADAVREAAPDTYVQAGLGTVDDPTPWIVFTKKPGASVLALLADLPVDVQVLYGAPASSRELEEAVSKLVDILAAQDGVVTAGAGVPGKGDRINAFYSLDDGARAADSFANSVLAKLAGSLAGDELPVPVSIVQGAKATDAVVVQGGRDLNTADTNNAACTAGFTVNRGSERGLVTAQHCPNGLRYGTSLGVIQYVTDARDSLSGHTDLQYHRTIGDNTVNTDFRATNRTEDGDRTVTGVMNPPANQVVCHWGRTSGYECSTVDELNFCITTTPFGKACNIDSTTSFMGAGGDSGGPVFYGSDANGIFKAVGSVAYFTRISAVHDFLDATVRH